VKAEDVRFTDFDTYGRKVGYLTSAKGQEALFKWLRENPHRLHLGRIGFDLRKADGSPGAVEDLSKIEQTLELWTGQITSRFEFDGTPVTVQTSCAGDRDAIVVRVTSPLIADGRLRVRIAFPYGTGEIDAADWKHPDAHTTTLRPISENAAAFDRQLDATQYRVGLAWEGKAELTRQGPHEFSLAPRAGEASLGFVCAFAPEANSNPLPSVEQATSDGRTFWQRYWTSGGAIDLGGSSDPRAKELERRIVLSQYLMRVNDAGDLPPAETGLTCNSWFGKFHLEMHWWHDVHFALWGRQELFERSMDYYPRIQPLAQANARRQGYAGARWPKMVGPDGHDSPSPIGPLLIWQQPHPIYYAELCYRAHPDRATLDHWWPIIRDTADFMASYAVNPKELSSNTYVLGPPLKTVPEHTEATTTRNPTFELTYWRFGLRVAQQWRERLAMPRDPKWDEVLKNLAAAPTADGVYLSQEGETDTYTQWNWEHPSILGAYGVLPGDGIDEPTMRRSFERTLQTWRWDTCWGWDFPMTAMCAARLGRGDAAIDALLNASPKNEYLANGHNYQRQNLQLYLPGNGGLLTAVAMMAAGWDGGPQQPNPGFPREGWNVRWEGLKPMP